jgi:hypothetical protein
MTLFRFTVWPEGSSPRSGDEDNSQAGVQAREVDRLFQIHVLRLLRGAWSES